MKKSNTTEQITDETVIIQQQHGHITLWALRIILRLNLKERFIKHHNVLTTAEILQPLGLMDYYDPDMYGENDNTKKTIQNMEKQLLAMEKKIPYTDDILRKNIQLLSQSLTLTEIEKDILQLSASFYQNNGLGFLSDMIGELNTQQAKQILAVVLSKSIEQIDTALNIKGTLFSSGLLMQNTGYGGQEPLRQKLILPDAILSTLCKPHQNKLSILESFFKESPAARLTSQDFQHIAHDFSLIQQYISTAINNKLTGVNILIYGVPGTGKTEMVRALCEDSDLQLHEITMQQDNGTPIHGTERFSTLKLSQKLLADSQSSVLLFDEVEDVFPVTEHPFFGTSKNSDMRKAWVNNILEKNKIPTFWLCNSTQQIDSAYLRRFDYVLKLRPLTSKVRLRILKKYLSTLPISEAWLENLAEQEHLVPAIVERAAKVVSHLQPKQQSEAEILLDKVIGNTLEVMGLPKNASKKASQNTKYNINYLNPDVDLVALCNGLKQANSARICLYGAPGTGKSAFAHYLADILGKTVLVKRASDILSKWVGEAEKNIAGMFEEATQNDQILLLDEADSFLQERQSASQSWEITQVNELLVQMEVYKGIFIASTNLMRHLDTASLRRFEFKIKFDFMKPQQAWALFEQILSEQGNEINDDVMQHKCALRKLDKLTPGDFAAILRQSLSLAQPLTPQTLIDGLTKEIKAKPDYQKAIGFV